MSILGNEDDERTLDKLINGTNVTVDDASMWLTLFGEEEGCRDDPLQSYEVRIVATLPKIPGKEACPVSGIRVWNYNKSIEVSLFMSQPQSLSFP
jgi:hypothetical protein